MAKKAVSTTKLNKLWLIGVALLLVVFGYMYVTGNNFLSQTQITGSKAMPIDVSCPEAKSRLESNGSHSCNVKCADGNSRTYRDQDYTDRKCREMANLFCKIPAGKCEFFDVNSCDGCYNMKVPNQYCPDPLTDGGDRIAKPMDDIIGEMFWCPEIGSQDERELIDWCLRIGMVKR